MTSKSAVSRVPGSTWLANPRAPAGRGTRCVWVPQVVQSAPRVHDKSCAIDPCSVISKGVFRCLSIFAHVIHGLRARLSNATHLLSTTVCAGHESDEHTQSKIECIALTPSSKNFYRRLGAAVSGTAQIASCPTPACGYAK